jgi:hypothetical protein
MEPSTQHWWPVREALEPTLARAADVRRSDYCLGLELGNACQITRERKIWPFVGARSIACREVALRIRTAKQGFSKDRPT